MKKRQTAVRIARPKTEMVAHLKHHLRLLKEHMQKVVAGDDAYCGEVAAKLRLLVYEGGTNKALLLNLMDEYNIHPTITINGPPVIEVPPGYPRPG